MNPKFKSFEGDLWLSARNGGIVRRQFAYHFHEIAKGKELCATLRAGEFAWPGGYRLFFLTADGATLSFASVRENLRQIISAIREKDAWSGWQVVACQSTEGESETVACDHSGEVIFDPNP